MKLSEYSVKNSLIVNSLSVFLIVAGVLAAFNLEREAFPDFSFDVVTVRTDYPGASPDIIERHITIPIEKELREVDDIDESGSVSVEGLSLIILKLDPDAPNKDRTVSDIGRAVEETRDLPEDLEDPPLVRDLHTRNRPLVEVSLSGPLSEEELRRLAVSLETQILDLSGVASVERKGIRNPEIWVEVDPQTMASHEIALKEVMESLTNRHVNIPGGLIKTLGQEWILRTSGELKDAQEVKHVVIRANEGGNWVRIEDIARVSNHFAEETVIQRTDGSRAMNLLVVKKDQADAIRLMKDLKELVESFRSGTPAELKIALINDLSYYIKRRLNVLLSNGWIGLILVMIPVVLFLSPRIAVGAGAGMIIAFLSALAAMNFLGMSINLISMFGMIMVLGMLVDEDLVVAENIARYLEQGMSRREAAIRGAAEVGRAIISVVLTTIIAFVPLLFMTGVFGKFVSDIPKVVIITLTASLLEALIILPSHLSDLNRTRGDRTTLYKRPHSHHLYNRVQALYLRSLRFCLKHAGLSSLVALVVTTMALLYAVFGMRFILFPARGIEVFFIRAEAALGTPLEFTEEYLRPLEELAATLPENELDHIVTEVGIRQDDPGDPFSTRGSHVAQIKVLLTPQTRRNRTTEAIMESLRGQVPKDTQLHEITFDPVKPGPPVGKPIAVKIRGDDYPVLEQIAETFKTELHQIAGVLDIRDDYEPGKGEMNIIIDEAAASRAGLTHRDIALTVRRAFEGMTAAVIQKTDDEVNIVVRLPEELRYDQSALESLLIRNPAQNLVPLKRVARLEERPGISVIKHDEGHRVITVTANVDEAVITSREVNKILQEKLDHLEREHPGTVIHYGGEAEDTRESMQSLLQALIAAALLIFLVLLVTFGSFLQTFITMFSIPFGVVGVVIGFSLLGEPFSFLAMLGVVGLTGIVVDSSILIFIFVNKHQAEAPDLKAAILKACELRLRPIFLTTLTTVLGVLPAAYGIGGSDPFIRPMALTLNWGLAISMFFTLYAIPCLYYVAESIRQKITQS